MSCHMCGVDEDAIVPKEITHHTMFRGKLIVVENVPVRECVQCGETYFHAKTSERLEKIVWQQDEPFRLMEVPVFDYAEPHPPDKKDAVRQITFTLQDEDMSKSLQEAAEKHGCSVQEIAKEAVKQWLLDMEQDEMEMAEIEAASREWRENGEVEAGEFFEKLKRER